MMYIKLDSNKYVKHICYFKPENLTEFIQVENQEIELGVTQYINGTFIVDENKKQEITNAQVTEDLRGKRSALLKAFDTYKSNVAYGIEKEDATTYSTTIKWYQDLLDLKNSAFVTENIPTRIKYYLSNYELDDTSRYVTYDNNGNETLVSEAEFKEHLKANQ